MSIHPQSVSINRRRVFVAGHRGMVGKALMRAIAARHPEWDILTATRDQLDLGNQSAVFQWLADHKPDLVIIAAAKVGGIVANATYPAEFLYENLAIATHLIEGSRRAGIGRLLFLGSSCIYPKLAPQPISEDCLLEGALEPTNEAYALAKIAGLKLCQHYRQQYGVLYHSAMPTNLYGPGDNYHPVNSHVIPALLRRFHEARIAGHQEVVLWGSGSPRREFLHVDDLARACLHLLELENPPDWVNVGTGEDLSIAELGTLIQSVVGYEGNIGWDLTRPDGTPRKLLDVQKIKATGWSASIPLRQGLEDVYREFSSHFAQQRQA